MENARGNEGEMQGKGGIQRKNQFISLAKSKFNLHISEKSCTFAVGKTKLIVPKMGKEKLSFPLRLRIEIMRRHSYIVLLLTAIMWVVCSSNNCRQRLAADCYEAETTAFGAIVNAHGTSDPAEQQINFILSTPDCALPAQIEKIQVNVVQLSARQQLKRISETIFGHNANTITTHRIARRICRSQHILLNLETYDIGFPFSAFW